MSPTGDTTLSGFRRLDASHGSRVTWSPEFSTSLAIIRRVPLFADGEVKVCHCLEQAVPSSGWLGEGCGHDSPVALHCFFRASFCEAGAIGEYLGSYALPTTRKANYTMTVRAEQQRAR